MKKRKNMNRIEKIEESFKDLHRISLFFLILAIVEDCVYILSDLTVTDNSASFLDTILLIILTIVTYSTAKSIHKKEKKVGIIGILIGIFLIIFSGLILKICGAVLLIDSIFYLSECNKN